MKDDEKIKDLLLFDELRKSSVLTRFGYGKKTLRIKGKLDDIMTYKKELLTMNILMFILGALAILSFFNILFIALIFLVYFFSWTTFFSWELSVRRLHRGDKIRFSYKKEENDWKKI